MKLNLLIFSLSALFLLAACGTGIANAPTPELNTVQTAVAGTQTATAPEVSTVTAVVSGQGTEGPVAAQPAQGLPQKPPDARGIFDHRQDSSIFVDPSMVDQQDQSGPSTNQSDQSSGPSFGSSSDPNAPKVEVVVTAQTIIYKDVTVRGPGGSPVDFQVIEHVEPGSLDEIGQLCLITVWGSRTGDRVIADVLVYAFPNMQSQ
jgi:hypothetical protein